MSKSITRRAGGFSLIEIMVALVIGMLAIVVMMQVFALSESRQRNASSGGDAQTTGISSFYQIQRDISLAGYGFAASNLFNCNFTWTPTAAGTPVMVPLAPVTINPAVSIIPAGDPNTDRLLVMYGNGNGQPQGNVILGLSGATYNVQMSTAFNVGERIIAAPAVAAGCASLMLDQVIGVTVTSVISGIGMPGSVLFSLGTAPKFQAYAVRGGNLTMCDYFINDCGNAGSVNDTTIWIPVASNVVGFKAQYGRDRSGVMDGIVDEPYDQVPPATGCDFARISAIRFAIVSRSGEFDKEVVTTTAINATGVVNAPTWLGDSTNPLVHASSTTLGPDTAADEPWKHYRYRVFQSVAAIRNIGWMGVGVPIGC